ncbi:MAG: VanZ family protein [Dysgonamonadaceae bacterium]|jgi:VanZ family protein|nr:VanZ family protein [Dysgonamonadaceae bacterium]
MNLLKILTGFILKFWISITFCTVIVVLCVMHTENLPKTTVTYMDKIVHFLMFFGLSGAVFFDNTRYLRRAIGGVRIFFGSFVLSICMGGGIEIVQQYVVRYRTGDWKDLLFDAIGATVAVLICLLINRCLRSRGKG